MKAPDADLISLCAEYMRKHAEMMEMSSSVLHSDAYFVRITSSIIGLQELRDQIGSRD
jgi:hypothetical protein